MKKHWLAAGVLAAGAGCVGEASAQDVAVTPIVDARLRWEDTQQDGLPRTAQAVTARIRSGIEATRGRWSALVESEATLAIVPDYNDGNNGRVGYPTVPDPQNIELNRAQLRYAMPGFSVTAGRQRLQVADQRFIGAAPFRQNEQTFDAVRVQWSGLDKLSLDAGYIWSVRTAAGIDGRGSRPQSIGGDTAYAVLGYRSPLGTVSGFAYWIDEDEAILRDYQRSSKSYGGRFEGSQPLGEGWKLGYVGSVARQSDYHRNPNRYVASYYLARGSLGHKALTATAAYEVLGRGKGAALTSFQTPLASNFGFQGWAQRFNPTPRDGVRDLYGTVVASWSRWGGLRDIGLNATMHRFNSDRGGYHQGDELDLLASAKLRGTTVSARWAHYRADRYATDTDKVWLTLEWVLP